MATDVCAPLIACSMPEKALAPSTSGSMALPGSRRRSTTWPTSRASGVKCVPGSLGGNCGSVRWRTMPRRMRAALRSQRLDDIAEPPEARGSILVRALAVGVCGTDRELIDGLYGEAMPGRERLVLGHESLGRVISAPPQSGFMIGDMVVGIVRHPDPVPCPNCALGEWDMCRNGRYTERGIKQADGFAAERWRNNPEFTIKVNPALGLAAVLLEPASILAKAWEHIERIGRRARWAPSLVLVTGAGPVGPMAALMGVQRRREVHVLDRNDGGPQPELVRELGATHHVKHPGMEFDIVIECTGAPKV